MVFRNGNFATTLSFARVLAGATVVTGFAATLPLAVVLAFATMLGRRRTTALAFAGVLAGASIVGGFAASVALAVIHTLARVFITAFVRCFSRINAATLGAGKNPSYSTEQQFVEISSFHTHPGILHNPRKWHVYPARDHDTHPAARYAAISVSGQDVPHHRGLAAKLTPHGNTCAFLSRPTPLPTPLPTPRSLDHDQVWRHLTFYCVAAAWVANATTWVVTKSFHK